MLSDWRDTAAEECYWPMLILLRSCWTMLRWKRTETEKWKTEKQNFNSMNNEWHCSISHSTGNEQWHGFMLNTRYIVSSFIHLKYAFERAVKSHCLVFCINVGTWLLIKYKLLVTLLWTEWFYFRQYPFWYDVVAIE